MKGFFRVKLFGTVRQHRDTMVPAWKEHIDQPADPGPIRRRPEEVIFLGEKIMGKLHPRQMAQQHPVCMQGTLGRAGSARCINNERRIIGPGFEGAEIRRAFFNQLSEIQHLIGAFTAGDHHRLQIWQITPYFYNLGQIGAVGDDAFSRTVGQTIF